VSYAHYFQLGRLRRAIAIFLLFMEFLSPMFKKKLLFLWSLSLCVAPLLCEPTHLVIEPEVLAQKPVELEKEEETETLPETVTTRTKTNNPLDKYYGLIIGCSSVLAALYGLGMYYYPKKTALLALACTAGTFLGISIDDYSHIFSHDNNYTDDNDYAGYMKSEARKNLLYTSIICGLYAGYVYKIGVHA
jgi:hypothetical protein